MERTPAYTPVVLIQTAKFRVTRIVRNPDHVVMEARHKEPRDDIWIEELCKDARQVDYWGKVRHWFDAQTGMTPLELQLFQLFNSIPCDHLSDGEVVRPHDKAEMADILVSMLRDASTDVVGQSGMPFDPRGCVIQLVIPPGRLDQLAQLLAVDGDILKLVTEFFNRIAGVLRG